jgi:hypothetical protein
VNWYKEFYFRKENWNDKHNAMGSEWHTTMANK